MKADSIPEIEGLSDVFHRPEDYGRAIDLIRFYGYELEYVYARRVAIPPPDTAITVRLCADDDEELEGNDVMFVMKERDDDSE